MLKIEDIQQAGERLQSVVFKTPLVEHSEFFDYSLFSKLENLQKTGSFKIRGAYNKIASLSKEECKNGIICASAGNHAQGVGYAATLQKIKTTIVMPKYAPLAKIDATRKYDVEVILAGDTFNDAYQYAKELQLSQGSTFIEPYDDLDVIAGQGTVALEILEKQKSIDY